MDNIKSDLYFGLVSWVTMVGRCEYGSEASTLINGGDVFTR
jgi:hypothetical protein